MEDIRLRGERADPEACGKGRTVSVFTHSRRAVEVIFKGIERPGWKTPDFFGRKGQTDKIAGYRGGYTSLSGVRSSER